MASVIEIAAWIYLISVICRFLTPTYEISTRELIVKILEQVTKKDE